MRRCLTILVFLIVLPVQWVWGSAAPYCQHEADPGHGWHFGHHQHEHKAGDASAKSGAKASAGVGSVIDHVDCEACHLACCAPPPANDTAGPNGPVAQSVPELLLDYRSHIPRAPDRPDRPATTPAVRSGGGVVSDSIPSI